MLEFTILKNLYPETQKGERQKHGLDTQHSEATDISEPWPGSWI